MSSLVWTWVCTCVCVFETLLLFPLIFKHFLKSQSLLFVKQQFPLLVPWHNPPSFLLTFFFDFLSIKRSLITREKEHLLSFILEIEQSLLTKMTDLSSLCVNLFAYPPPQLKLRILTIQGNLDAVINVLQNVLPSLEEVTWSWFCLRHFFEQYWFFNLKVSKIRGERTGRVGDSDARLLVHQSQIGCIIGRGGAKVKELREVLRHFKTLPILMLIHWVRSAQKRARHRPFPIGNAAQWRRLGS